MYVLYHLNTHDVGCPLKISVDGKTIKFEPNSTYLGVKLDQCCHSVMNKNPRIYLEKKTENNKKTDI